MAKLINKREGAEYYIVTDPASVGRHKSNDIVLPGITISRFHAQICTREDGYYVRDLGSTYGTFVNGQSVPCGDALAAKVKDGDVICLGIRSKTVIGEYELTFSAAEVPAEAAAGTTSSSHTEERPEPGRVEFSERDGVLIARLSGAFRGPECDAMVAGVVAEITSRPLNAIIDFDRVTYVNSYMLRAVSKLEAHLEERGLGLTLAAAKGHVERVFKLGGTAASLGMHPSVEEALGALASLGTTEGATEHSAPPG